MSSYFYSYQVCTYKYKDILHFFMKTITLIDIDLMFVITHGHNDGVQQLDIISDTLRL